MYKLFEEFAEQCQIVHCDDYGDNKADVESYTDMVVRECIRIIRTQKLENIRPHETHQLSFNEGIEFGVQALYTQTGVKAE